ncbi:riboflavin kinase, partial [Acetobacter senegalensis]
MRENGRHDPASSASSTVRAEKRFNGLDELKAQIAQDAQAA